MLHMVFTKGVVIPHFRNNSNINGIIFCGLAEQREVGDLSLTVRKNYDNLIMIEYTGKFDYQEEKAFRKLENKVFTEHFGTK